MHNGKPKSNLRRKRKALSWLGDLLEIVGVEVMAEGVGAGTHSEGWRHRISNCKFVGAATLKLLAPNELYRQI